MSQPLRARVRAGRLLLDEPSDLPDGTVVELVPASAEDEPTPSERHALRAQLAESIRSHVPGSGSSVEAILAR